MPKTFRDFPAEYIDLATQLAAVTDRDCRLGPFADARAAHAARREFYRFRDALREAAGEDERDEWLAGMWGTVDGVTVSVESLQLGHGPEFNHSLVFRQNPLLLAIRQAKQRDAAQTS